MVTRMFLKMMIYLTIGVVSINYLIDYRMEIMNYLSPTFEVSFDNVDLDEDSMLDSHQLLD